MIPKIDFFPYSIDKRDTSNVSEFLTNLPQNLELIFQPKTSNFKSTFFSQESNSRISVELFDMAYEEVRGRYSLYMQRRDLITIDALNMIGFTGSSLQIKAMRLNELWDRIATKANQTVNRLIDWGDGIMRKLLKKFLSFLNSLLGSLAKLLPPMDSFKEFKEFLESQIDED